MKEKVNQAIDLVIAEYGCVLEALGKEDKEVIRECEKTGHIKYHSKKFSTLDKFS